MEKKKKLIGRVYTNNNYFNIDTGECIDSNTQVKTTTVSVDNEEAFVLMYISILNILKELDAICVKVLVWCALNGEYNSNRVNLSKPNCNRMSESFDLKYNTIKKREYETNTIWSSRSGKTRSFNK